MFVCEKGTDRIIVYKFDAAAGTLVNHSETMVGVGGGARHLAVHPDGKTVYANEEAGAKITAYAWDSATGAPLLPDRTTRRLPPRPSRSACSSSSLVSAVQYSATQLAVPVAAGVSRCRQRWVCWLQGH